MIVLVSKRVRPKCRAFCHRKEDQYLSARSAPKSAAVCLHLLIASRTLWSHGWAPNARCQVRFLQEIKRSPKKTPGFAEYIRKRAFHVEVGC
jgi:hypothetical protein